MGPAEYSSLSDPQFRSFTRDQVPVSLTIYLKWQLTEPLKLTTHGYNTPFDALRDKTQSILTQIVAHCTFLSETVFLLATHEHEFPVDYSSMVKQRSLGPDSMEPTDDRSSAFLDALRTRAMDEMHLAALEYGIILKDLGSRLSSFFPRYYLTEYPQLSWIGNSRVKLLRLWTNSPPEHFKHKSKLLCVLSVCSSL